MKKLLLTFVSLSFGTFVIEARNVDTLQNNKQNREINLTSSSDSVSYAIGGSLAKMAYELDSTTINVDIMIAAMRDVFNKEYRLTDDQMQAAISKFVALKQEERSKVESERFVIDSINNAKTSAEYYARMETEDGFMKTQSGLLYKIERQGEEPKAEIGDILDIHYAMYLPDGTLIDSSYDRGEPMHFTNDQGTMIPGFTEGVMLLGKGGKATIVLPYEIAYGTDTRSIIGPCQVLTFDIEILDINKPTAYSLDYDDEPVKNKHPRKRSKQNRNSEEEGW